MFPLQIKKDCIVSLYLIKESKQLLFIIKTFDDKQKFEFLFILGRYRNNDSRDRFGREIYIWGFTVSGKGGGLRNTVLSVCTVRSGVNSC